MLCYVLFVGVHGSWVESCPKPTLHFEYVQGDSEDQESRSSSSRRPFLYNSTSRWPIQFINDEIFGRSRSSRPKEGWISGRKSSTSEARAKAKSQSRELKPWAKAKSQSQSQESKYSVYDPEQSPMIDGNKSKYDPEPRLKIQIIDSEDENVLCDPEVN